MALIEQHARAERTREAYEEDARLWRAWCAAAGRQAVPADEETVCLWVVSELEAGRAVSTIRRRLAGIAAAHRAAGVTMPRGEELRQLLAAATRQRADAESGAKRALRVEDLAAMVDGLPETPAGLRNRALLLFGFASGLRRSELASLNVGDVRIVSEGLLVRVRRSKTDQAGEGREFGIRRARRKALCPVRAVEAWLRVYKLRSPELPLLCRLDSWGEPRGARMSGARIAAVVKAACERIGLDARAYGAHSLRAGMITAAAAAGETPLAIQQRSGHRSLSVLSRYVRPASAFLVDPLAKVL